MYEFWCMSGQMQPTEPLYLAYRAVASASFGGGVRTTAHATVHYSWALWASAWRGRASGDA